MYALPRFQKPRPTSDPLQMEQCAVTKPVLETALPFACMMPALHQSEHFHRVSFRQHSSCG
jgi:hypothetical protein